MTRRLTYLWRARGRRLILVFGAASLLTGLLLVAYGALSLLDGDSQAATPPVVDLSNENELARVLAPSTPSAAATAAPVQPPLADSAYRIVVDRIGVNAPVKTYGLDENAVPQVPTGPEAKEVVAWYDFSARPGTGGNAVFAGHVTWNGPAVFYGLGSLQPGDLVRLLGEDGTELAYRVSSNFAVDPEDPDSLEVMQPTSSDVITLITCGGTFFRTDDPVAGGDYTLRVIVRADLVSVSQGPEGAGAAAGG